MLTEKEYIETVHNMRHYTAQLEREGDYWSDSDRAKLREMSEASVNITDIAIILQRTEPAIIQQMEKMDLFHRKDNPRRNHYGRTRKCRCRKCTVPVEQCPEKIPFERRGRKEEC